ncbi:MAG: glycosyltransferase family 4 protein [Bacillota bacterium]
MRIGIFTNCYHPMVNGVVGAVSLLRKGFIESGQEVYVFAPGFEDFQDEEEGIFRYPAIDLTRKVKYPVAIPFSPRIQRIIAGLKLDLLHSHHPFVLGPVALRIARRRKVPVIYTFHTQYDQYTHYLPLPGSFVRWVTRRQVKRFSQAVNQVTTPSESARQILLGYGVTNPIRVIPNPVDLSRFPGKDGAAIRQEYHLGAEKLLINIGRIAPEKNLGLLLHSFRAMLLKTAPGSLKLMIVGDGPELNNLIRLAGNLDLKDQVIFTGLVEPERVPHYLAAADLFVMTSTTEVKPLAQLEALASGLPIVAVRAAGANDTIIHGENGLLVPEKIGAISEAVLNLIFDEQRYRDFQKKARLTAAGYSYPKIAGEYLSLFRQVLAGYQSDRR